MYQQKKRASYDDVRYTLGGGGDCESGDDGNGNGDSVDDDDDDDGIRKKGKEKTRF